MKLEGSTFQIVGACKRLAQNRVLHEGRALRCQTLSTTDTAQVSRHCLAKAVGSDRRVANPDSSTNFLGQTNSKGDRMSSLVNRE